MNALAKHHYGRKKHDTEKRKKESSKCGALYWPKDTTATIRNKPTTMSQ